MPDEKENVNVEGMTEKELEEKFSESPDTETETVEETPEEEVESADTETETEEEEQPDQMQSLMTELELDKRYKDPEVALRSVKEKDRHIEELNQEKQRLMTMHQQVMNRLQQKPQKGGPTREQILEMLSQDPQGTIRKMGYVNSTDIEPLQRQIHETQRQIAVSENSRALEGHDDLQDVVPYIRQGQDVPRGMNETWDKMSDLYDKGIRAQTFPETIDVLRKLVSQQQPRKKATTKVSSEDKANATTTASGRAAKKKPGSSGFPTEAEIEKMSVEQIEELYRKHGLIDE